MKALFYVTRPLELICAIETRKQFNITDSTLIIHPEDVDIHVHKYLLEESKPWNKVIWLEHKFCYGLDWLDTIKSFKKETFDFLFLRAFEFAAYFIFNLKYTKLYFLDDGNATITLAKEFKDTNLLNNRFDLIKNRRISRKIRKKFKLLKFIKGIKLKGDIKTFNFFTFYNIKEHSNFGVTKNKLEWFKSFNSNIKEQSRHVYYISSNLIASGLLDKKDFFNNLEKVKNTFSDKTIYFIPHMNDEDEVVKEVVETFGFILKRNTYNIEIDLMLAKEKPELVLGSITSALITLSQLFKDNINIKYAKIEPHLFLKNNDQVEGIYNYQSQFVTEIELN